MAGRPHLNLGFTSVRFEVVFFVILAVFGIGAVPENADGVMTVQLLASWLVVASVSILIHELGHAIAFRAFGSRSAIVLHGFGGLTSGAVQTPGKSIIVSLAGPLFPLILFGIPSWYLLYGSDWVPSSVEAWYVVRYIFFVNVIWSIVNLLPMLPLDGGNVTASAITLATRRDGVRPTRYVSIVVAAGIALYALVEMQWLFGALFGGLIAFSNYSALKGGSGAMPYLGAAGGSRGRAAPAARRGAPPPAPGPQDPQVVGNLVVEGYRALDRHDAEAAATCAKQILATQPVPEVKAHAVQLAAWALLQQAETRRARAALGEMPQGVEASPFLVASVELAEGDLAGGLDRMANAFVHSDDGVARVRGADFVASAGLTRELAEKLVATPEGVGLVPAMRLQTLLAQLQRPAHAAMVDEVLLGGAR
jgi:Zn-dependent protease